MPNHQPLNNIQILYVPGKTALLAKITIFYLARQRRYVKGWHSNQWDGIDYIFLHKKRVQIGGFFRGFHILTGTGMKNAKTQQKRQHIGLKVKF